MIHLVNKCSAAMRVILNIQSHIAEDYCTASYSMYLGQYISHKPCEFHTRVCRILIDTQMSTAITILGITYTILPGHFRVYPRGKWTEEESLSIFISRNSNCFFTCFLSGSYSLPSVVIKDQLVACTC